MAVNAWGVVWGRHPRVVTRATVDVAAAVLVGSSRSSPHASRCCPGSGTGTRPSSRPSRRCWARPTRRASPRTCSLAGWRTSLLTPFGEPALRMNLFAALCVAVAAAVTVDLVRALTRSALLGVMAGARPGPHRRSSGTSARTPRPTRSTSRGGDPASPARGLGGRRRDRTSVAAAVVFGLAAGEPFADAVARPADRPVRPGGRPGHPAPAAASSPACTAAAVLTVALVYLELPAARRPLPRRRWSTAARTPGTGSGTSRSRSSSGAASSGRSTTCPASSPTSSTGPWTPSGRSRRSCRSPSSATAIRRPRYALLTGTAVAITCFFAASYVNADDRPLLPRARC